ncbi:hypothetical protein V6N13_018425 [Hibiscus sabdariffa]
MDRGAMPIVEYGSKMALNWVYKLMQHPWCTKTNNSLADFRVKNGREWTTLSQGLLEKLVILDLSLYWLIDLE